MYCITPLKIIYIENILIIFAHKFFIMPRRRRFRKIIKPPEFKGYKPYGHLLGGTESVELLYEEYEAIKLSDYDRMKHEQAAELMGVSRATFARVYQSARQKIAKALVETKEIKTVFGYAILEKGWFKCSQCEIRFSLPEPEQNFCCPLCQDNNIEPIIN